MAQKDTDKGRCTHFLKMAKGGTCRAMEETNRARCTHHLETVEGGAGQDTERNRPRKAHSLSGEGGGRYLSRHGKKQTE